MPVSLKSFGDQQRYDYIVEINWYEGLIKKEIVQVPELYQRKSSKIHSIEQSYSELSDSTRLDYTTRLVATCQRALWETGFFYGHCF